MKSLNIVMKTLLILGFFTMSVEALKISYGLSARQGERETMEDRYVGDLTFAGKENQAFFAIYDGHGGDLAAMFAERHLSRNLCALISEGSCAKEDLLREAFLRTDHEYLQQGYSPEAGTTAVVSWVENNNLRIAWAGDSRAVLSNHDGGVAWASIDHKPDSPEEKSRIEAAGGFVIKVFGAWRANGYLSVSRALGDGYLKKPVKEHNIISAEPAEKRISLQPGEHSFLILACDGVWDVISNEDAVSIVQHALANPPEKIDSKYLASEDHHEAGSRERELVAATVLCNEAFFRGSKDNLSVVVITFDWS